VKAPVYLDSSALVKLVFEETETDALERFLSDWPMRACSVVGGVEVVRIARLVQDQAVERHARLVLNGLATIHADESVLRHARELEPRALRSLDAIHLATALSLMPDLAGMVVYDERLAAAARHHGLTTWAPA
jgi:predicted nucleic acid-binding protein